MQSHDAPGDKAPDRRHGEAYSPLSTAGGRSRDRLFGSNGNDPQKAKRVWNRHDERPTDDGRARPHYHLMAHAASPRSHNGETMTSKTRGDYQRTGTCNKVDTATERPSSRRVRVGECDTPTCDRDAETITPAGYVCASCAAAIEREYREARARDRAGRREA